ncbi:MAG: FtsX-like permease family protein [Candidatus Heimdallarchaeota archaeon]|nr:FtsX-like permease family protein [Candidatus Heimdallarchaeota archaeon]
MGILATKIRRDLWRNKGRSISIVIIIAFATALYGGLLLMYINAEASFDALEDETHIESVRFSLNDYINITDFTLDFDSIDVWDYRLTTITGMRTEQNGTPLTAPLYGIPGDTLPKVNSFVIQKGDFIDQDNDLLVITQFFKAQNEVDKDGNVIKEMKLGDSLWLDTPFGKEEFNLKGTVMSPEYVYMIHPVSGLPDLTGLAASWLKLDTLTEIMGLPDNFVNEILVKFNSNLSDDEIDAQIDLIKEEIKDIAPFVSYTLLEDEMEQTMKEGDVGALDEFARAFGTIILLLALFVMYDNISKLIASQRNVIGTMRALGGHKSKVVNHYTWLSLTLGIIGVLIGIPLGYEMANAGVAEYGHILNLPDSVLITDFHIEPFYEAFAVNFGLVVIISLLASIGAARIKPREAMASAFITMVFSKKPIIERITSKIPGLNTPSITVPIRSLLRHRRKTILTILTYGISMVLLVASFGFMDSFDAALSHTYDDLLTYDMEAHFMTPILPAEIAEVLDNVENVTSYEFFSTAATEMQDGDLNKSVYIEGLNSDTGLRKIDYIEGKFPSANNEIVLSVLIAKDFNLSMGDEVELYNRTFTLSGIAKELVAEKAFLKLSVLQDILDSNNNVTSVMIKAKEKVDDDPVDHTVLKKVITDDMLDAHLPLAIIVVNDEVVASFDVMIQGLLALVAIMVIIGFGTIALFAFNTIVLDVISRETEFINFRTLGARGRTVFKVIALQSVVIAILGSFFAIPAGYWSTKYVMDTIAGDLLVMDVYIAPASYGAGIFTALIASGFGVFSAYKRIMKLDLANAMRTRVAN